jgi:hypothetical protein
VILIGNPCPDSAVRCSGREPHHAGCAMESVEQYRQYAEECRRLAERAPPKEKVALLEIAAAWDECANEAAERGRKTVEGTVFRDDPQAQNGDTS